jgi:hypothetical protein
MFDIAWFGPVAIVAMPFGLAEMTWIAASLPRQ